MLPAARQRLFPHVGEYGMKILNECPEQAPPGYLSYLKEGAVYAAERIHAAKLRDIGLLGEQLGWRLWRERR